MLTELRKPGDVRQLHEEFWFRFIEHGRLPLDALQNGVARPCLQRLEGVLVCNLGDVEKSRHVYANVKKVLKLQRPSEGARKE